MALRARSGNSWVAPAKAWVRDGGAWKPVARAFARSANGWTAAAFTGAPVVTASITSASNSFTSNTVSWSTPAGSLAPTTVNVAQYSCTDKFGNNKTLVANKTGLTGSSTTFTTAEDTLYIYEVTPVRNGVSGTMAQVRYATGHSLQQTLVDDYGWLTAVSADVTSNNGWTSSAPAAYPGYPESNLLDGNLDTAWMSQTYASGTEATGYTNATGSEQRCPWQGAYTGALLQAPDNLKARVLSVSVTWSGSAFRKLLFTTQQPYWTGWSSWRVQPWSGPKTNLGTARTGQTASDLLVSMTDMQYIIYVTATSIDPTYITAAGGASSNWAERRRSTFTVSWNSTNYPVIGTDTQTLEVSSDRWPPNVWYGNTANHRVQINHVSLTYNPWGVVGNHLVTTRTEALNSVWYPMAY